MTPPYDFEHLAKLAYEAYGKVTDHKNYQGLPMPKWEDLSKKIQQAWTAAVRESVERYCAYWGYEVKV